jgi:CubicO group peptidase (beta-lactamase class C family)
MDVGMNSVRFMIPSTSQLEQFRSAHQLPALVMSIFSTDTLDTRTLGEVEEASPFPIASVTKTFTADLVLGFADGQMLDRPIREVLPDFALADPDATTRMTPRDALCHFSGLPPHTWAWVYGDLSRADFIRERLPHLPSVGPFHQQHRYSNLLYAVLGQWIEAVSGQSWETSLQQVILDPLHLKHTALLDENWAASAPAPHERCAGGIRQRPPFFAQKNHLIAPASEMSASIPDLAAWGQRQLQLPSDDARWKPHNLVETQRPHPSMGPLHYGLGWRVDTVRGEPRVWHSGQCSGYSSLLVLHPERNVGFAAAANLHATVPPLQALDLWIHHDIAANWLPPEGSEVRGKKSEVRRQKSETYFPYSPIPQLSNSPIPGLYTHPGYGDLEILITDDIPHSRYQNSAPTPLHDRNGIPQLQLPGYSVTFPITQPSPGRITVPFETQCEHVVFTLK